MILISGVLERYLTKNECFSRHPAAAAPEQKKKDSRLNKTAISIINECIRGMYACGNVQADRCRELPSLSSPKEAKRKRVQHTSVDLDITEKEDMYEITRHKDRRSK